MEFLELVKERYSCRSYKDCEVEQELLDKVLEAGRLAPTAKNNQPQHVYVLKSKEAMEKVNSTCKCIYGAPMCLMICVDKNQVWVNRRRGDYTTADIDGAIVGTHMMLQAAELGLGTCWVGMFSDVDLQNLFELPENIFPVALMPIGYPSDDSTPIDRHYLKKELSELVSYL